MNDAVRVDLFFFLMQLHRHTKASNCAHNFFKALQQEFLHDVSGRDPGAKLQFNKMKYPAAHVTIVGNSEVNYAVFQHSESGLSFI